MSPGNVFYLIFAAGKLSVRNAAGTVVLTTTVKGPSDGSALTWTANTVKSIVWDVYQFSIYIAYADGFPANTIQVLTWDGVSQTSRTRGAGPHERWYTRRPPSGPTLFLTRAQWLRLESGSRPTSGWASTCT